MVDQRLDEQLAVVPGPFQRFTYQPFGLALRFSFQNERRPFVVAEGDGAGDQHRRAQIEPDEVLERGNEDGIPRQADGEEEGVVRPRRHADVDVASQGRPDGAPDRFIFLEGDDLTVSKKDDSNNRKTLEGINEYLEIADDADPSRAVVRYVKDVGATDAMRQMIWKTVDLAGQAGLNRPVPYGR